MAERGARVLIVDRGGRAAVTAQAYSKSPEVSDVLIAPGNDLIKYVCERPVETFPNIKPTDFNTLVLLAMEREVDLVHIGDERAIEAGVSDAMRARDINTSGVSRRAGQLEYDKAFAKKFMEAASVRTPRYEVFNGSKVRTLTDYAFAERFLREDGRYFVKAAGLADGKGAFPVNNRNELREALERAYAISDKIVIEDLVEGEEFSAFYLGDGENFVELGFAQDHKTIYENDQGENTGGMGAVSPTNLITSVLKDRTMDEIVVPTVSELKRLGIPFQGDLYIGGMYNPEDQMLWALEYNTRFGDPEAQVVIPSIDEDYYVLNYEASRRSGFCSVHLNRGIMEDGETRVSVAAVANGYPGEYSDEWGKEIFGLSEVIKRGEVTVFGAAVVEEDGKFYVASGGGGRLFHLMTEGVSVEQARATIAGELSRIYILGDKLGQNRLHTRRDIGLREIQRAKISSIRG